MARITTTPIPMINTPGFGRKAVEVLQEIKLKNDCIEDSLNFQNGRNSYTSIAEAVGLENIIPANAGRLVKVQGDGTGFDTLNRDIPIFDGGYYRRDSMNYTSREDLSNHFINSDATLTNIQGYNAIQLGTIRSIELPRTNSALALTMNFITYLPRHHNISFDIRDNNGSSASADLVSGVRIRTLGSSGKHEFHYRLNSPLTGYPIPVPGATQFGTSPYTNGIYFVSVELTREGSNDRININVGGYDASVNIETALGERNNFNSTRPGQLGYITGVNVTRATGDKSDPRRQLHFSGSGGDAFLLFYQIQSGSPFNALR